MEKYIYEYRINKKGAECFRTRSREAAMAKLEELKARKPNVRFELQTRHARLDRYGVSERNWKGETNWSIWN